MVYVRMEIPIRWVVTSHERLTPLNFWENTGNLVHPTPNHTHIGIKTFFKHFVLIETLKNGHSVIATWKKVEFINDMVCVNYHPVKSAISEKS